VTRAIVVGDSGAELERLTASLAAIDDVEIARHASGRVPVGPLVHRQAATLVVIGELRRGLALERLNEIHAAAPGTPVVVLESDSCARWLADALRAGAAAVLPGTVDAHTLGVVLHEAVTSATGAAGGSAVRGNYEAEAA
jgi:DNA-binding NarL/FixJ family response regulator